LVSKRSPSAALHATSRNMSRSEIAIEATKPSRGAPGALERGVLSGAPIGRFSCRCVVDVRCARLSSRWCWARWRAARLLRSRQGPGLRSRRPRSSALRARSAARSAVRDARVETRASVRTTTVTRGGAARAMRTTCASSCFRAELQPPRALADES
jgi:hypothetical protein